MVSSQQLMHRMIAFPLVVALAFTSLSVGRIAENLEYISLNFPSTTQGVHIPRLGLGTAGLGHDTALITEFALESGMRLIDTAQAPEWYSEEGVGQGLKDFRQYNATGSESEVVVVTKVHPRSFEKKKMEWALRGSRLALYNDEHATLDVVLLHSSKCWPGHCTPQEESISWRVGWKNLEDSMESGKIRAIGVSNFDVEQLKEIDQMSGAKVSVVQNWMDPFHQDAEVRAYAVEHNIVYMAYSSFGTQWQGKYLDNPVLSSHLLNHIADKHECSVASVVLSWLLQLEVVAIPRASKNNHIKENAAAIRNGSEKNALRVFLDEDDMDDIKSLDGMLDSAFK
jgi:diketogulonate reductase-like aldo/keto reductase